METSNKINYNHLMLKARKMLFVNLYLLEKIQTNICFYCIVGLFLNKAINLISPG